VKDKWQIILSGVGGQGLIACGSVLAEASTLYEDKNATLTSSYGVETRGTFTKSDIIISEEEIYFPEVLEPDIVLSLAQVAYNRYVSTIGSEALLVYDNEMVLNLKESSAKQHGYPFTSLATELGHVAAANMIALGVIISLTGIIDEESIYKAINDKYAGKPKIAALNISAIKKGLMIAS
jgi:2-oxoglutarate ferredoxin oxidoreductase subunit gamma